jgi:hypothetical protein
MAYARNVSKSGPPIADDTDEARPHLIAADAELGRRLKRALERGRETMAGVLGTVAEPNKYFHPWRVNRMRP